MVERSRRNKEDEVEDRATRMILATAALSAVVALFAGPANAYFPEGDGVNGLSAQSQVRQPTQSVEPGTIPYLSHGIGVDESLFAGQSSETLAAPASSASVALDPAIETAIESRSGDSAAVAAPTIPYLSHGVGVDESQFSGQASQVDAQHAALQRDRETSSPALGLDPAIQTAIEARSNDSQRAVSSGSTAPLPHGLRSLSPVVESGIGAEPAQTNGRQSLGLSGDSPLTRISAPEPEGLTGDGPATRFPETVSTPSVSGGSDIDWEAFGFGAGMVALAAAGLAGVLMMRRRHTVGLP